jgi:hypothetical protein
MRISLFRPSRVAEDLAMDRVDSGDQAFYLMASLLWSVIPYYALLVPEISTRDETWRIHIYEFVVLAAIYVAGTLYCLRCCTFEPKRHFLKDLPCLFVPVSIISMLIGWGAFYAVAWGSRLLISQITFYSDPGPWLRLLFSTRATDTLRFVTLAMVMGTMFLWTGRLVAKVATKRAAVTDS